MVALGTDHSCVIGHTMSHYRVVGKLGARAWVWFISQPPLYDCNYLQIDRATTAEHNVPHVLGTPTLSPLPGTSFPSRLFI
jgi:hypothetical protein